jgi:hypothetical protein
MNLRNAANALTSAINPNISARLFRSVGAVTLGDGTRVPLFQTPETVTIQEQALTADEIAHLDSLNIQGKLGGYWINGQVDGIDRLTNKGGDLLIIDGAVWLVVAILEGWRQSGWCHFAAQQQVDAVPGSDLPPLPPGYAYVTTNDGQDYVQTGGQYVITRIG